MLITVGFQCPLVNVPAMDRQDLVFNIYHKTNCRSCKSSEIQCVIHKNLLNVANFYLKEYSVKCEYSNVTWFFKQKFLTTILCPASENYKKLIIIFFCFTKVFFLSAGFTAP